MSVNRAMLQAAFDIVELLHKEGISAIIAGGAARDIFFGVAPKDFDVICAGVDHYRITDVLLKANLNFKQFPKYHTGSDSDRLAGVWKIEECNIDIILYDTECVSEALDKFDYNLNQFAIVGAHRGIDGAYVRFMGEHHWSTLVRLRDDARGPRAAKMEEKFFDLAWRRATGELDQAPVGGPDGLF